MTILIFVLLIAAFTVFVWGIIKLFRKGQRRRGLVFIASGFGIFLLSLFAVDFDQDREAIDAGYASYEEQQAAEAAKQEQLLAEARALRLRQAREEQDQLDAAARDLGYSDYEHQQRAKLEAQQEKAREARQAVLGDFPNAATKAHASELGIVRYAAYQQLGNLDAIRSYCSFYEAGWQIEDVKRAQIEAGGDEEVLTAKAEADYLALRDNYNMQFGLVDDEVFTLSDAGHWLKYCDAFEKGWGVFGVNSAARADRQTARDIQDALTLVFLDQLSRESTSHYFNRQDRPAVSCRSKVVDEKWYVGCRLRTISNSGSWRIVVIGKSNNGRLFFSPLNGKSIALFEKIWSTVPADLKSQITAANFVGPRLPISDVLAEFE